MDRCPRCGIRLLPGAIACINCELPIIATPADAPPDAAASAYAAPGTPSYQESQPSPYGAPPGAPYVGPVPYAPGNYPTPGTTNGLSIAGVILGVIWLGGLGSLLAVIFGHISRGQIRKYPQRGAGLSLAALIIGYFGVVASIVFYAELPTIINSGPVQDALVASDLEDAADAERSYLDDTGTYTNDPVALQDAGFAPTSFSKNTILAAYNGAVGFCLVGIRDGGRMWALYDSERNEATDNAYPSVTDAQSACAVRGVGGYVPIA